MRRFIFSSAMLGIVAGGWNTLRTTKKRPNDWVTVLMWISWALTAAIAIGGVAEDARQRQLEADKS